MKYDLEKTSSQDENITYNFFKYYDSKILKKFKKNYSVFIKTQYGRMEIKNRLLDTRHRDIISAIFRTGKIQKWIDGDISVNVSILNVLKELRMTREDETLFIENLKEISDALFYVSRCVYAIRILSSYEYKDGELFLIFNQKFLELEEFKFILHLDPGFNQ